MTIGPSIVFSFWNNAVIINMTVRMMTVVAVEKAEIQRWMCNACMFITILLKVIMDKSMSCGKSIFLLPVVCSETISGLISMSCQAQNRAQPAMSLWEKLFEQKLVPVSVFAMGLLFYVLLWHVFSRDKKTSIEEI